MNKVNQLAAAAILATGVNTANAESTSTESINTSNQIEVVKSAVCDKTNLALACHKAGLEMPTEKKSEMSSNEIRDLFLAQGVNPTLIEGVTIGDYQESVLDESKFIPKEQLFGDTFTKDNIADKLESIAKYMNNTVGSQFKEGDWTISMNAMNPNEDEAKVLNDYVAALDANIDPLTAWQGATKLIAIKRFVNHSEEVSDSQKETMEFVLADNIYGIIKALKPELLKEGKILVLPQEKYQGKSYKFIETNYELVAVINKLLPQKDQIKSERITDFQEVYAQVLEQGKSEYIDTYLATDEAKEDEVTREEMIDEYAELLDFLERDVYENDFPELLVEYAPNLTENLLDLLPLKGESKFAERLAMIYQTEQYQRISAQNKAEGDKYAQKVAELERIAAQNERIAAQNERIAAQNERIAAQNKAEGDKYAKNTELLKKKIKLLAKIGL